MSDDLTHYMEATAQLHKENEILATTVDMNGRRVTELKAENAWLRAVVEDIVAHANPIAEDDEGFVAVGYTVTIGAIHRAIAALQGAQTDVSVEAT